jgi:hypothetical protein
VKVVSGESNLLQIVFALRSTSGLTGLLNSWQKQGDENGNDCNDNQ